MQQPVYDFLFPMQGETLPALHGYYLYAALSQVNGALHEAPWLGIHPVQGVRRDEATIRLRSSSRLGIRAPLDRLPLLLGLAGHELQVHGHRVVLGHPEVHPLKPASCLSARMVTFRDALDEQIFRERFHHNMSRLGVSGELEIGSRQIQLIKEKKVVGYRIQIRRLSAGDSLTLQIQGLGGRRRMGCGLLQPEVL